MGIAVILMLSMLSSLAYAQSTTSQSYENNIIIQKDIERMSKDISSFKTELNDGFKSSKADLQREVDGLKNLLWSLAAFIVLIVGGIQAYLITRVNRLEEIIIERNLGASKPLAG